MAWPENSIKMQMEARPGEHQPLPALRLKRLSFRGFCSNCKCPPFVPPVLRNSSSSSQKPTSFLKCKEPISSTGCNRRGMFTQHHRGYPGKVHPLLWTLCEAREPIVSVFPLFVGGGDWHIVDFQCGVSFRCTEKWLSYTCVRIYFLQTLSLTGYHSILSLVPRGAQVLAGYAVSVLQDMLPRIYKTLNISEKLRNKSQGCCQMTPVLKSKLGWYLLSSEQGTFTLTGSKNFNPGPCLTVAAMRSGKQTHSEGQCR